VKVQDLDLQRLKPRRYKTWTYNVIHREGTRPGFTTS